jgi:hypothetical protein
MASEPDLSRNTIKSSFDRAVAKLVNKGIVKEDAHNRILTSDEHQQEIMTMQCTGGLMP